MSGSTMAPKVSPISGSMWRNVSMLRAIGQKATEVVLREPGQRFLGAPKPIAPYAKAHWEFAWLSVAAHSMDKLAVKLGGARA